MIRAKAAFQVCKFASANLGALEDGIDRRQIYAEDEISEDIELGSRMHAWGFKSIFIGEKLATGEVCCAVLCPRLSARPLHPPDSAGLARSTPMHALAHACTPSHARAPGRPARPLMLPPQVQRADCVAHACAPTLPPAAGAP